ncbi:MAG: nucleotidyltransferase substrate binding protein [Leptospira sp.]|nr:nucleotidyltransferase substrate binding protein [Leptospira sp.]
MEEDIRWKQRLANYASAVHHLREAVHTEDPSDLEKEGTIQRFEFTHELAWKVMKDYLEYEGFTNITGSRSASKEAFKNNLVPDGQIWMDMIESRNQTVHTYDAEILNSEYTNIIERYYPALLEFLEKMEERT